MSSQLVRRSVREKFIDLNGRGYLSDLLGCSVNDLEAWIQSESVLPHLQLWYKLCIRGVDRYNEILDKINRGDFAAPHNPLEEELLLTCLGEGVGERGRFGDIKAPTSDLGTHGMADYRK